jgi:hypothetical protein
MDKLKIFLAVVKKQQFWVLCGVMLLTTLICWWLSTNSLDNQYKQRVTSINGDFSGAQLQPNQPNPTWVAAIGERNTQLKNQVFNAWQILYEEQREKNPFPTKVLGEGFEKQFNSLKLPQGKLDSIYREKYQTYLLTDYLPELLKIIDVRRSPEDKDIKGAVGGAVAPAPDAATPMPRGARDRMGQILNRSDDKDLIGIVDWEPTSFDKVAAHFSWTEAPSTLEVVLAQEDLWVYEALLRVIQSVNKKANANTQANAAVKRINALEIGKDTRDAWRTAQESVFKLGRSNAAGMSPNTPPPTMAPPTDPMGGAPVDRQAERDLFTDRYVDDKGQALAVEAAEYPYVKPVPPEFKMMPIHLNLVMDQRHLPQLLVECANSNMPIEVKRIRVLKATFEAFDIEGGPAPKTPGQRPMPGRGGPKGPMKFKPAAPGAGLGGGPGTTNLGIELGDFDVPVEIFAVIYIYNPPDKEKLGIAAAAGTATGSPDPAAASVTPPTTPPASTPGK